MKKVVYGVSRYVKGEISKLTGIGYITDTDLVIACMSKKGTPYIRVFEDCIKDCHSIPNRDKEYKGGYYEIRRVSSTVRVMFFVCNFIEKVNKRRKLVHLNKQKEPSNFFIT